MKSPDELEQAHDLLVAILLGEIPELNITPEIGALLNAAATTLCWVLDHDHNPQFENNLERLKKQIAGLDYILHKGRQPGIN